MNSEPHYILVKDSYLPCLREERKNLLESVPVSIGNPRGSCHVFQSLAIFIKGCSPIVQTVVLVDGCETLVLSTEVVAYYDYERQDSPTQLNAYVSPYSYDVLRYKWASGCHTMLTSYTGITKHMVKYITMLIHCVHFTLAKVLAISNVPTVSMLAAMMGTPVHVCFEFLKVMVLSRLT